MVLQVPAECAQAMRDMNHRNPRSHISTYRRCVEAADLKFRWLFGQIFGRFGRPHQIVNCKFHSRRYQMKQMEVHYFWDVDVTSTKTNDTWQTMNAQRQSQVARKTNPEKIAVSRVMVPSPMLPMHSGYACSDPASVEMLRNNV